MEKYELQLCEKCFFYALAILKKERADEFMFDENFDLALHWRDWTKVSLII